MNATKSLRVTDFFFSEEIKAGRMREMIMLRGHKIMKERKKALNIRYFISFCAVLSQEYESHINNYECNICKFLIQPKFYRIALL